MYNEHDSLTYWHEIKEVNMLLESINKNLKQVKKKNDNIILIDIIKAKKVLFGFFE